VQSQQRASRAKIAPHGTTTLF
jgi:hypothetical protein